MPTSHSSGSSSSNDRKNNKTEPHDESNVTEGWSVSESHTATSSDGTTMSTSQGVSRGVSRSKSTKKDGESEQK